MNESKTYICNKSHVTIKEGDILNSTCDVIVSSDNIGLQMSVGVSRKIHEAAGAAIDIDLDKTPNVDLGDVVVTTAGDLPQRYVFHCIADKRSSVRGDTIIPIVINRAVAKCLQLMPLLGTYSIAFPAIGTGAVGLSTQKVAQSMLQVLAEHLNMTNHSLQIEIFAWGKEKYDEWIKTINNMTSYALVNGNITQVDENKERKDCDVFISYSWKDEEIALKLDKWLEENGIAHFLDRNNINGGQDHKEVIIENLRKVKLVLFLSSKDSNVSPAVKGELCNAINLRIPIIPLRIDMTPYRDAFMYDLVNTLWIDISDGLESKFEDLRRHISSYEIKIQRCTEMK